MPPRSVLDGASRADGRTLPQVVTPPPGPRSSEMADRLSALESPAFDARRRARLEQSGEEQAPIVYAEGIGANVVDVDGNVFVDLTAGFGALLLGHRPERVGEAVQAQSNRLWLALGDVFGSDTKLALCERLAALFPEPGARVMLGSSGADAVTAAIKTAVLATGRPGILAFEGAYHGLSHGPLAACGLAPGFREPFAAQLNPLVRFAPYPRDESSLDATMRVVGRALQAGDVGAVLVEPVLGRGGCIVPPAAFLPLLRAACDEAQALLVCDEIWTGLGRSGAWLASSEAGVTPDLVCLGKGLGGGLPMSACIGSSRAMQGWGAHGGTTIHTATHFGAPLACAAAVATLDVLRDERLPERAGAVGARWRETLGERLLSHGARDDRGHRVVEVRGRGLMVGLVLDGGAGAALAVARRLLGRGYIVLTGGREGDVLTLTPPLTIDPALLDAFTDALSETLAS
jgi:4-aminobutyrate aminotransferase/(S)-3-amino-2-methylpropionate transaminase